MTRFMTMVEAAHARAEPAMNVLPIHRSMVGMSVLGDARNKTATPANANIRPPRRRQVIRSFRNRTARNAVNSGLRVIISEASPAAVKPIPYMNRTWYMNVENKPMSATCFHCDADGNTHWSDHLR